MAGIPSERALARASEHLAAGRYAQATGAFRAVLSIEESEFRAHLGLADAGVARGASRDDIIDDLVRAAGQFADSGRYDAAFAVLCKALVVDPARLEVHIDVADLEARSGHPELAASRLENLARAYNAAGQTDEAEAVLAAADGFRETAPAPVLAVVTPPAPAASASAAGLSTRARTMPAPEAPVSITVSVAASAPNHRPAPVRQRPVTTNKARVRGPSWRPATPAMPAVSAVSARAKVQPLAKPARQDAPAKPATLGPRSKPMRLSAAPRPTPVAAANPNQPTSQPTSQPRARKNHATAVRATAQRGAKLIVGKLARPTAGDGSGLADRLRRQSNRSALRRSFPAAISASTPVLHDTFDEQPTSLFAAP